MKTLAFSIDLTLYGLVIATMAVILYKGLDLWLPWLLGKTTFPTRMGSTPLELEGETEALESGLTFLAMMAATTPFIGLAGTVVHIMEALRGLSGSAVDIAVISGPIATALKTTLVGLGSAVPAAMAYNLMQRRIQVLHNRRARQLATQTSAHAASQA